MWLKMVFDRVLSMHDFEKFHLSSLSLFLPVCLELRSSSKLKFVDILNSDIFPSSVTSTVVMLFNLKATLERIKILKCSKMLSKR